LLEEGVDFASALLFFVGEAVVLPLVVVVVDGGFYGLHLFESLYVAEINQIGQNYFFKGWSIVMVMGMIGY